LILKITPAAAIQFDCTPDGIKKCRGKYCTNLRSYWPVRAYYPSLCPYLDTETGCKLTVKDRPIDCLLYPFFINKHGTMVVHNRCYGRNWICHENLRVGKPLVESLASCLIGLFGETTYTNMRGLVMEGKSYIFKTSEEFAFCRMVEDLCIKYDLPIIPRQVIMADYRTNGTQLLQAMEEGVIMDGRPISPHYREV
jgi:hypothetical protein